MCWSAAAKSGTIYVVNRDNMGHFHAGNDSQIVQSLPGILPNGLQEEGNYSAPAFFNGYVYFAAVNDTLKAFQLTNGLLSNGPTSQSLGCLPEPWGVVCSLRQRQLPMASCGPCRTIILQMGFCAPMTQATWGTSSTTPARRGLATRSEWPRNSAFRSWPMGRYSSALRHQLVVFGLLPKPSTMTLHSFVSRGARAPSTNDVGQEVVYRRDARRAGVVLALPAEAADQLRIYVSNEDSGEITVLDPAAVKSSSASASANALAASSWRRTANCFMWRFPVRPTRAQAWMSLKLPPPDRSADGIGVVDLATFKLLRTLPSGQDPEAFDLSPDGKTLFISNEETAEVTVLDVATGRVTRRVPVGREPEGVTVRPDGKVVYVTCEGEGEVVAIDTATLKVISHMHTERRPRSVVFTKDGSTAFATAERGAAVTVLDGIRHKAIETIKIPSEAGKSLPARPMGSVLAPDGRHIFVSNGRGESVAVIDVAHPKGDAHDR